MKRNYDLTKLLKPYAKERLWVVFNQENTKVVASGRTIKEVLKKAKENQIKNPSIIQAIPDYSGFIPFD